MEKSQELLTKMKTFLVFTVALMATVANGFKGPFRKMFPDVPHKKLEIKDTGIQLLKTSLHLVIVSN